MLNYAWTRRLMRQLARFLVHAPARFLEAEYFLSYTSILRMDKEVLAHDIPKPKLDEEEGILIDEKHLGASKGFATLVVNAATGEPLEMVPGRDAHCLDPFLWQAQG